MFLWGQADSQSSKPAESNGGIPWTGSGIKSNGTEKNATKDGSKT
jgi:hypothetical protein